MKNLQLSKLALGFVIFILLLPFLGPIAIVGPGERGAKVTMGRVSPVSYTEGIHFVTPFISHMVKMDVKTQKLSSQTELQTKDIQIATIDYALNYNLSPSNVPLLYKEVGKGYESILITPVAEGIVKDVIGRQNASELIANREKVTQDIKIKLQEALDKRYFTVTDFNIVHITYSGTFMKAIEDKVTAEQDALRAKNKTVEIQENAKQKLISAEAEAKSMAIRAHALSQNKALVEYEAVQKWDGKLPEYMMGNSIPFINFQKK